jgi:hypothetical protein
MMGAGTAVFAPSVPRTGAMEERRAGAWLSRYPIFLRTLQHGEMEFQALPPYAKQPVLRRVARDEPLVSSMLADLRVAYVELSTSCAVEVLDRYLCSTMGVRENEGVSPAMVEIVASEFPAANVPHVARPPCLLSPGSGIFIDGWSRFLAYWSRDDKTIPLLAVDWTAFYKRLVA